MKAAGAAAFNDGKPRDSCPVYPARQRRYQEWWQNGWDEAAAAAKKTRVPGSRVMSALWQATSLPCPCAGQPPTSCAGTPKMTALAVRWAPLLLQQCFRKANLDW